MCGDRDELVAEARKRIADKPERYYNKIYGVQEVGGTSVLYLSAVPFEQIGLRTNVPQEPLPETTWRVLRTGARRCFHRHGAAGRHLVDHQPARRSCQSEGPAQMKRRLPKITVWRAIFAAIMAERALRHLPARRLWAGRLDQPERPVPLGHLDRLRRHVRRGAGGRRIHAGRDRPHLQYREVQARPAAGDSDRVPRLCAGGGRRCCSTWAGPTASGIRW